MRHLKIKILTILIIILAVQSCVDKEYDWNNLDTNGVIYIPPIPLGSLDTIHLHGLPLGELPSGIPIPDFSIVKGYEISGLFEGNAVKNFFFEGANAVEISFKIDVDLEIKGIVIDVYLDVMNQDDQKNTQVIIPKQRLVIGKKQQLTVRIGPEYMKYMENAKDLRYTFAIIGKDATIWIGENDYIYMGEAIIKTGGFHYDFNKHT